MAAGSSSRTGGTDKIFYTFMGRPVLHHTAAAFASFRETERIIVVTRRESFARAEEALRSLPCPVELVEGGSSRTESVANGLDAVGDAEFIAIHDGARPFITHEVIDRTLRAAALHGAAVPAIPVKDTIKSVGSDGFVTGTPARSSLRAVQTPQIFRSELIRSAYSRAKVSGGAFTDDASVAEAFGFPVFVVDGDERNVKLTTARDLELLH